MSRDYYAELRKQINFIKTSCKEYDAGHVNEAIRIAAALRIVFHETKRSHSIIHRTPVKHILSTVSIKGKDVLIDLNCGLVFIIRKAGNPPKFSNGPIKRIVPVIDWWENEPVYDHKESGIISRKKLVLMAADKDGGAHVDDTLDPEYESIVRGEPWQAKSPIENGHLASLRQIGYEILNTPEILSVYN